MARLPPTHPRRLDKLAQLPQIALEYETGKIPENIHWDYQNKPGDFSVIYRKATIDDIAYYLFKNVSGQWEYLPLEPTDTTDASQSGLQDQLQQTKWEYFSNPGENSKDYRRAKKPDGSYVYMKKNEYGDWELVDRIPETAVAYNHEYGIWHFC